MSSEAKFTWPHTQVSYSQRLLPDPDVKREPRALFLDLGVTRVCPLERVSDQTEDSHPRLWLLRSLGPPSA